MKLLGNGFWRGILSRRELQGTDVCTAVPLKRPRWDEIRRAKTDYTKLFREHALRWWQSRQIIQG